MNIETTNNVVEIDAEQAPMEDLKRKAGDRSKKRISKSRKIPPRSNVIISAPREKPPKPVSFRLTAEELRKLKENARLIGKRSLSDIIRKAVQLYVEGYNSVSAPASLGIVDGIYAATIHDDVVELANQLRMLEFVVLKVTDRLEPSPDTEKLRLLLTDTDKLLGRIAGSVVNSHCAPCT